LLLEDRVEIGGVDAGDAGLSSELEWNTIGLVVGISVGNIDCKSTVVEL